MLLAIALLPLALPHWWEPNRNKLLLSAGLGLPMLLLYLAREPRVLAHTAGDYVPFAWTLRLWRPWLTMTLILLVVYFVWDTIQHRRESGAALRRDQTRIEPLRIHGGLNCVWLAGVVAAVALLQAPGREIAILGL